MRKVRHDGDHTEHGARNKMMRRRDNKRDFGVDLFSQKGTSLTRLGRSGGDVAIPFFLFFVEPFRFTASLEGNDFVTGVGEERGRRGEWKDGGERAYSTDGFYQTKARFRGRIRRWHLPFVPSLA